MFDLGPWEIALILVVILLLFGAKRLPEVGRAMGKGIREFKTSVEGKNEKTDSEETKEPTTKS